jgi:hypothetical protein
MNFGSARKRLTRHLNAKSWVVKVTTAFYKLKARSFA